MRRMQIKHYARCIRRDVVEYLAQLQIIAWDDRDDTDDQILSTDKIWSSVLMDGHSGQLLRMVMRKKCKTRHMLHLAISSMHRNIGSKHFPQCLTMCLCS